MSIDERCVNTIRCLAVDQIQKANSGHPGMPLGCAPMGHVLFNKVMRHNPENSKWINRDRFIVSNGHGCALLYSLLHLSGYKLTLDDLKNFRQLNSLTPGHPEANHTDGVEVTTGPLGQGFANGVGVAIAEAHLAATFNKPGHTIIDNYTYVMCGDGCLMEGVSSEAASVAGHLGLGKLIVLWDDNKISIDGGTDLAFSEDVVARFQAYGWQTLRVDDGNTNYKSIEDAIAAAKQESGKPTFIAVKTTIGFGSVRADTSKVHGSPIGPEDVANVKKKFGLDPEQFFQIPDDVAAHYQARKQQGIQAEAEWTAAFAKYEAEFPDLAKEFKRRVAGEFPADWESQLPTATPADKALATRAASRDVLAKLFASFPEMVGGSADLNPSCLTYIEGSKDFQKATPEGRNIRFGVREFSMAAICNGLAAYGGVIPFCSTFLNFVSYAFPAMRLSALSKVRVVYVMTHDSIGLGEDGPTHQPVEILTLLRATPNMVTIRPADSNETAGAYIAAMKNITGPTTLALSRQGLPQLEGSSAEKALKGAYVLVEHASPDVIYTATGSEVALAVEAAKASSRNVRVVSFPSWELFEQQSAEYKASVFPVGVPVLAIEAAVATGWERYSHGQIAMTSYGGSAPAKDLYKHFGFTAENINSKGDILAKTFGKSAPSLARPF
eukprot:TRINITY_DN1546_c0_g1_i1.p1 TRINITY_DN1546_c0_g1~~TRINITY_DN1546_c0_g1_i1.p1  ORF type:complete len:667 (+),score=243.72 TRINITY_DN1546_c0_g1_i1:84-2084(+)